MELKLNKLKLENVKGLKSFDFPPDGQDASVRAENGVGKTTLYDGWLWLLFGKDSDGKTDFNVRPLDQNNQPIPNLIVAVEAELTINNETHVLRKEQHEKILKQTFEGETKEKKTYPTKCKIDEAPKKVGEFQEFIENLCPEELFRQLTDLAYFNGKMHWSARRKVLMDVAGRIPKPAGFEKLLSNLNGRILEDYEKIQKDRKKAYDDERKDINPRIDELQRSLNEYAQTDKKAEKDLKAEREKLKKKIEDYENRRRELLNSEKQRQQLNDRINHLTCERLHREIQLKNDTSGQKKLRDEKAKLENDCDAKRQELTNIQHAIRELEIGVTSIDNQIAAQQLTLNSICEEFKQADTDICPTCLQKWPTDMPKPRQADITKRGNKVKKAIDELKQQKSEMLDNISNLLAEEKVKAEELKSLESKKEKRIDEIDKALKNRVEIDPTTDEQWQKFTAEIEKLQEQKGEPVSDQLDKLEAEKGFADELLHQINESLAQADNIEKSRKRIAELEDREKELAQLIADCEKEIDQIKQYKLAESKMIEAAVNDRFQHVEFKLFDYYLNGEINDQVCVAVLNGVPYPDMSSGQKILSGIDVVNTLSDHYGVTVPLFIDHAESITYPIEADTQTILLRAVSGIKKLQVEVEQKAGKAVT